MGKYSNVEVILENGETVEISITKNHEEGGAYIFIWACHPHCIKENMNERQKLIWYNPNNENSKLVKEYFSEYVG